MNEERGGDSITRGHATEDKCFLHVLGVALPKRDAGGLLRGIVEQPAHLLRVQIRRAAGSGGRAEAFREAMSVAMRFVHELLPAQGHRDARANVVPERDGAQELRAIGGEAFSGGQCRRDDGAARMRERRRVRIVGLVGLGQDAIRERGFDRAAKHIGSDHGGDFLAAVSSGELNGGAAGREFGARNHRGDGVEDVMLRFFRHLIGQCAIAGVGHVCAEPGHGGTDLVRRECRPGPAGRGDHGQAGLLKKPAAAEISGATGHLASLCITSHMNLPFWRLFNLNRAREARGANFPASD